MTHILWVERQNKLEIPKNKDEVNKEDIHDCDGRHHHPDTMVVPLTTKPKRKAETFRVPPTIVLTRDVDEEVAEATVSLRELHS